MVNSMPAHLHLAHSLGADGRPERAAPIRVVLADDHAVTRRTLRQLLDAAENVNVIAEAADISTAAQSVRTQLPRVLVLDLRLPNGSCLETIGRLRAEAPRTEVIVLTMEESPLFAQQALDAGAIGFVLKDRADSELLEAIQCAARGEEYVSMRVAAGLDTLRRAVDGDGLSPREVEVLRLLAQGLTNAQIAEKLVITHRTVNWHLTSIYSKLQVSSRSAATRYAIEHHLI